MDLETNTGAPHRAAGRMILRLSLLALLPAAPPSTLYFFQAGEPGGVVELKGDEVTAERLIEILAPSGKTRGIGTGTTHSVTPHCKVYRERLTRGVGVEPVAPIPSVPVHFAFNSNKIAPEAIPALDAVGRALASQQLASSCFSLEGHTDSIGSHAFNDRLSRRRAEAVVSYHMDKFGLDPQRLVAVGRGKRSPVADNSTPEGRQRNRRVQIVNMGSGEEEP
jgi:outer membrane protein OmpA-like peptidoglycan-associated protein